MRVRGLWLGAMAAMGLHSAQAEPRKPLRDDEILERTPRALVLSRAQLGSPQITRQAAQGDPAQALALADAYIQAGRQEGDPRFYAYAEAALKPWLTAADPPAAVILRRAAIRQFRHDFGGALNDLDALIAQNYADPQVWLLKASVMRVQGRYGPAMESCLRLGQAAERLVALTCACEIQSLGGDGEAALRTLTDAVARAARPTVGARPAPGVLAWSQGVLAGIAERQGQAALAERWYRASLAAEPDQAFVRLAYADFLLAQGRAGEVIGLVEQQQAGDGFLLRLALARAQQAKGAAAPLVEVLQARFDASRRRGERPHLADQARLELHLRHRPKIAYDLALENWRALREPSDALILAQSALATRDRAAARTVLRVLARQDLKDQRLARLRAQLSILAA